MEDEEADGVLVVGCERDGRGIEVEVVEVDEMEEVEAR